MTLPAPSMDHAPDSAVTDDLGSRLIAGGHLSAAQLDRARRAATEGGVRLADALVSLGLASESLVAESLADLLAVPLIGPDEWPPAPVGEASPRWLDQVRVLPLRIEDDWVVVAMADPQDGQALQALGLCFGLPVEPRIAPASDIRRAIARLYEDASGGPHMTAALADDDLQRLRDLASEAPVVRFVNRTIARAVEERATDIHLESHDGGAILRLRIDGDLTDIEPPPAALLRAVISRIKILAGLDIAERRLPQDGRIQMTAGGRAIDLRVSTAPTLHGESIVIRILDRAAVALDFAELGFGGAVLERWLDHARRPNGIILVTGPTSSGKTTTLYATLAAINDPRQKLFTIEDPVEYQLARINQIQVKPAIGLSFAAVLRSLLRQNPDKIMVGEIRDRETAQAAIEASLTGHLVLSTAHTNDAAGAATRLLDMGIEDYLIASTLNAVLAQRLVRRLCPVCRQPHPNAAALTERFGPDRLSPDGKATPMQAPGCPSCRGTGWQGRTMIAELLVMSDTLRAAMMARHDSARLTELAREQGMESLFDNGMRKVAAGITTPEEVLRVTLQGAR
jgi:general secretion pathway protein E